MLGLLALELTEEKKDTSEPFIQSLCPGRYGCHSRVTRGHSGMAGCFAGTITEVHTETSYGNCFGFKGIMFLVVWRYGLLFFLWGQLLFLVHWAIFKRDLLISYDL